MTINSGHTRSHAARRSRWGVPIAFLIGAAVVVSSIAVSRDAQAAEARVELGTAAAFSVLAGSTVTNTGPSVLSANLAVGPGNAVTGFPPGIVLGTVHAADGVAATAKADLLTAFNDADGRDLALAVPNDLVGLTVQPGLYASPGPLSLTGEVTLDGAGDPAAVFIFRSPSTLITGSGSRVSLINGAQACNVFWQVDSSATLGTGTAFQGTIMAAASITLTTGASLQGRAHALTGAVTLDTNLLTAPVCVSDPPPTSGTATQSSGSGGTGTSGIPTGPGGSGSTAVPSTDVSPTEGSPTDGSGTGSTTGGPTTTGAVVPVGPGSTPAGPPTGSTDTSGLTTPLTSTGSGVGTRTAPGADDSAHRSQGLGLGTGGGRTGPGARELSATGVGDIGTVVLTGGALLLIGLSLTRSRTARHG